MAEARGVLNGVRVLEMADWIAGPFATSVLGDFGAEVIRIDLPGAVANTRTLHGMEPADDERSPFFASFAHGKKSITLDVRTDQGREVLLSLIAQSTVLVEAFRPGTLEKWGLGWETLEKTNPALIMLRISGYGQTGPWSGRPGVDRVAQAFGGTTFVTGHPDQPPVRPGIGVADYGAGIWGVAGILLALLHLRGQGAAGRGQVIDQSLYEAILPMLCDAPLQFVRRGEIAERYGNQVRGVAPGSLFETSDGRWMQISASGEVAWAGLTRAMGRTDLLSDERFRTNELRDANSESLMSLIGEWVRTKTADDLDGILLSQGVPASIVQDIRDLMAHPQVLERNDFVYIEDPAFGSLPVCNVQPRLSRTPGHVGGPGPRLGEHNHEIYTEVLGLTGTELERLHAAGVI
jgi:formyl-CoA transferase